MRDILEISLLAGVAVGGQGNPAPSRAIGLLTFLALRADIPQSRSHLAGVFWPDSTEAQARTNLRRELHQLRNLLGTNGSLIAQANSLVWRDDGCCRVDVRVFLSERAAALEAESGGDLAALARHGTAAVEEYRGALLPGWYDEWVLEARDSLERQCIDLCDRVVAALETLGDRTRATALARVRVQLSPLEEPGYRQLMELQAAAGDRAGAMTTYHRCASVLEQELGIGPSTATMQAMDAIIGPRDEIDDGHRARRGDAERSALDRPMLIGRKPDLDGLFDRWHRSCDGEPGVVIVTGEAGMGKSRLVTEFARQVASQGGLVATARCFGASGRLALAPVADWLRSPALRTSLPTLEPVWRDEVDRLVPAAQPTIGPVDGSRAKVDAWQRLRFFEGLARAVLVSDRPTLLVLDDLQWCDSDTMLWVAFLVDLADRFPLLIVAAARDDELAENNAVLASMRPLRSAGRVTQLELGPFSSADTGEVAAQMLGRTLSPDDLALLQSATAGYPLYVVEAIRNLPSSPSGVGLAADDVNAVLRQRLANASPEAQEIAGLAAAVGRDFGLELVSQASDQDPDAVVTAVDELWRLRILRQSGQGYDFSHDLLRDVAYAAVPPARQWLHHRRLAEAIEVLNSGRLDDVAPQLAEHHARSGRPDLAIPCYTRAAEAAAKVFASAEAVRLLRLSLGLVATLPTGRERDHLELSLLQAISAPLNALHGYASPELAGVLTRSVELAESLQASRVRLASLVGLWASRYVNGDMLGSHALAVQALELSERVRDLAGQAHFAMGGSSLALGELDVAISHLDLARDLSLGAVSLAVGSRPEVHAQAWAAHARLLVGDAVGAATDARAAIARAREVNHPYSLVIALAYAAVTHQISHDLAALDADLAELGELCERYDVAYYREWGLVLSGWRAGGAAGIATMREGLAHLSADHTNARMPYWLSLLAEVHAACGDLAAAGAALDAARMAAIQRGDTFWLPEVLRLSAALQPAEVARQTLVHAMSLASKQQSLTLLRRCEGDLARLLAQGAPRAVRPVRRASAVPERLPNA